MQSCRLPKRLARCCSSARLPLHHMWRFRSYTRCANKSATFSRSFFRPTCQPATKFTFTRSFWPYTRLFCDTLCTYSIDVGFSLLRVCFSAYVFLHMHVLPMCWRAKIDIKFWHGTSFGNSKQFCPSCVQQTARSEMRAVNFRTQISRF